MSLSVEINGLDDLIHDFNKAGRDAQPLVTAALTNSTQKIQSNVRNRAPHRTGTLQRSVLNHVDYPNASVTVQEKYGEFIEYGTKPHDIEPKIKKALYWKGALNPYRRIHHPGTKAKPFFQPGVNTSLSYIHDQFEKVMIRLTTIMVGRL